MSSARGKRLLRQASRQPAVPAQSSWTGFEVGDVVTADSRQALGQRFAIVPEQVIDADIATGLPVLLGASSPVGAGSAGCEQDASAVVVEGVHALGVT